MTVTLDDFQVAETRTAENVLAETKTGNDDEVVMVGAHLDSVIEGPGINDNGSGAAALLEVAENMRRVNPQNTVRFALWGAEEFGLLGSEHYVANLNEEESRDIALYLNFDMIGSPNYFRGIYDGDGDGFGVPGPARVGGHRGAVRGLLRRPRPGQRADRLRRPVRLRAVHRRRHPGRWTVHRRRGHQDRGAGSAVRRSRRASPTTRATTRPATRSTTSRSTCST